jgi:hypothetical protein
LDLLTPHIFTTRDYRQHSAIADLHTLLFTVLHALRFSVFTSRILATDLSQSHCNFKSHMKSSFHSLTPFFLSFCNCQFRRLHSIQILCCQAHILAGWRLETRLSTLCCPMEFFFITSFHGHHRKHRLLLSHIVLSLLTAPLCYNGRGADHKKTDSLLLKRVCRWHMFTKSLPSNGYTRHNIIFKSHTSDI